MPPPRPAKSPDPADWRPGVIAERCCRVHSRAAMDFSIRSATAGDIGAMHALRSRVRENRLSASTRIVRASYRPFVTAGSAWVAVSGGRIAGFAAVDGPARRVWALFVDPGAEGLGIGRALHATMLEWAREQGIARLHLSTEEGSRAVTFYRRAGWRRTSVTNEGEVHFERSLRS